MGLGASLPTLIGLGACMASSFVEPRPYLRLDLARLRRLELAGASVAGSGSYYYLDLVLSNLEL